MPRPTSSRRSCAALSEIQDRLFQRALAYRKEHTRAIDRKDEFVAFFTPQNARASRRFTAASRSRPGAARPIAKRGRRTS